MSFPVSWVACDALVFCSFGRCLPIDERASRATRLTGSVHPARASRRSKSPPPRPSPGVPGEGEMRATFCASRAPAPRCGSLHAKERLRNEAFPLRPSLRPERVRLFCALRVLRRHRDEQRQRLTKLISLARPKVRARPKCEIRALLNLRATRFVRRLPFVSLRSTSFCRHAIAW